MLISRKLDIINLRFGEQKEEPVSHIVVDMAAIHTGKFMLKAVVLYMLWLEEKELRVMVQKILYKAAVTTVGETGITRVLVIILEVVAVQHTLQL